MREMKRHPGTTLQPARMGVAALQLSAQRAVHPPAQGRCSMNSIVYIVGAVVIVLFILGFLGLR